ncbi:DUF11 domain-containing protein, partial [Methanobacterium sp.]|uniref:DUF11 domain-containing protein n=1 Tax=Methanobacterium sp. TaxID=2164 RepID=UPI0025E7CF8B
DPLTKTITWIIPYMPKGAESTPGAIAFMNVYVRALDTGVKTTNLTNTVTLVSPVYAVQPSKSYSITVPEAHDIQVDQNVTGSTNYDDTITITITATNNGPDNATGVTIKDLLPSGLEWVSNTQSSGTTYDKTTGIWYIGNFNYGNAPKTLNITVRVKTTGTIKNTAFLTAPLLPNFLDWNYDNNAQTCVIEVPAAADIGVDQTINDTTPNYLDTVTITVYGKNYGPDYATNVKITDLLSPGLEYVSHTTNHGNYTNGVWTINNLQNGEEATLTIIAKVIEACSFNNTVNRTGGSQFDYNPSNDVKNVTLNVPEAAYIEVNKTATPSNPNYKDTVTYTITATNKGPDNATGVNINYTLPTGITLIGSSATKGSYTNGVWNIGSLQNGETVTLTITALINATGTITDNSLTVTQDQDIWNNTLPGPVNWNIPQSADIEVTQTVSNSTPTANNNVNFIINTTNNGPDNASGVEVTSKLPTGFTVSGWKVSWNGGLNWINNDSSYNPTTGLWTIGALTNGVKAILNITANATQMGNFTNNANKTAETQYDWNNTNNGQNVSLAVTGTIPDDIFTDEGTQSGTVNTDDGTTTAITLPFNITLYGQTYNTIYITVNGAIGLGAPIQGPYYYQLPESNTLNRYVAYIAPFWADFDVAHIGSVTYLITNNQINITWYQVPCHSDNWNSNRVNTVTLIITNESTYGFIYGDLDWKNDPDDSYPSYARISKGDNGATYKNFWTGAQALSVIANKTIWFDSNGNIISPHIGLNYTVNNSTPNYHDNVVYTIVATNTGTINATGVKVKALLPSGLNYVSSSSTDYDSATGIWNIGTLAPGESLILTLTAYVNKVGSIISYANTTAQDQYETNAYDSKSLTITVPNAADIAVAMTATTYTPRVGNDFYITITVTNNGPSTATGVQITDLLPYALQYRSTTYTSQGSYSSTTGVWNIGTLTSGQTATLTIRVRPRNGYGGQTVTNTATKTAETQYDPLTSNDSASINLNIRS